MLVLTAEGWKPFYNPAPTTADSNTVRLTREWERARVEWIAFHNKAAEAACAAKRPMPFSQLQ